MSAVVAVHDVDGYDGIKVRIRGMVDRHPVDLRVDVGFGDALVPPATRTSLQPFLDDGPPARVHAYAAEAVIAEKVETLVTKFPAIAHRLKDLLDVVMLANARPFGGTTTVDSLRATFTRRDAKHDIAVLDDMLAEMTSKKWRTDWAAMRKEKAVVPTLELTDAVQQFDRFVRPLLEALGKGDAPGSWAPGGPWS